MPAAGAAPQRRKRGEAGGEAGGSAGSGGPATKKKFGMEADAEMEESEDKETGNGEQDEARVGARFVAKWASDSTWEKYSVHTHGPRIVTDNAKTGVRFLVCFGVLTCLGICVWVCESRNLDAAHYRVRPSVRRPPRGRSPGNGAILGRVAFGLVMCGLWHIGSAMVPANPCPSQGAPWRGFGGGGAGLRAVG